MRTIMKTIFLIILFVSSIFAQSKFGVLGVLMADDALKYESIPNLTIDFNPLAANVVKNANNKVTRVNDTQGTNNYIERSDTSLVTTWVDSYINGKPALLWDATTSYGESPISTFNNPTTVFFVIKKNADKSAIQVLMDGSGATRNLVQFTVTNGYIQIYAGTILTGTSEASSNWQVLAVIFYGANSKVLSNNVSYVEGDAGSANLSGLAFGHATTSFKGYMARFLLYSRALTSTEVTNITAQLRKDYGF